MLHADSQLTESHREIEKLRHLCAERTDLGDFEGVSHGQWAEVARGNYRGPPPDGRAMMAGTLEQAVRRSQMLSKTARIHLAHAAQDKRFTARLARDLRARGRDVWFSQWAILETVSSWQELFAGLPGEGWLCMVLSPASLGQQWLWCEPTEEMLSELGALGVGRVPILTGTCELPAALGHLPCADFRVDYSDGLGTLLECFDASMPLAQRAAPLAASPTRAEDGNARAREYFEQVLRQCSGDISQAARVAGMESEAFYDALRRAGVDPMKFRS